MVDRHEKARRISWVVSERIGEVTTGGLSGWGPVWDFVEEPADAFLDAVARWEAKGSPDDLSDVQSRAEALVAAWREADQEYRESLRTEGREVVVRGIG